MQDLYFSEILKQTRINAVLKYCSLLGHVNRCSSLMVTNEKKKSSGNAG